MNTSSLPISRLINVSINLTPLPAQMQNLNNLLILGNSNVIDVVSRQRQYITIDEVAADFGTTSPEYLAAVLWFEQSPQPINLTIGRWAQTATAAQLYGAPLAASAQALPIWQAVATPGFNMTVDGVPLAIAPTSFAGITNLNGVANLVQTALNAANPSQFNVATLTTTQVAALTTAQIPALSNGIIQALNTADIAKLTTVQVGALTTVQIGALTTTNIAALTTAQVSALSVPQVAALNAREALGTLAMTCTWNSVYNQFVITDAITGLSSTVSVLTAPTATGNYSFGIVQPTANDTVTIGGTAITFVAGVPVGNQSQIGATVAATIINLAQVIAASTDINLIKFTPYAGTNNLYLAAVTPGAGGNALTITSAGTSPPTASGATLSGGATTDISSLLGGQTSNSGSYVANGINAESAANVVYLFDNMFGQSWYGLNMPTAVDADHLNVAAYIEAASNKHYYGVTTQEAAILNSGDTTNIVYQLKQLGYNRTGVQFSSSNPAAMVSALSRILTTNYNANNTVITLKYKQEPGIVPETLAVSQVTNLESYNANVFLEYNNNTAIFEPGVSVSGNYIDTVMGTDWLALDIMTSLYNLLYTSPTKIPQTDAGTHQLVTTIEAVCSQGVTNGLLAPGTWQSNGFGSLNTGDFMPKGYYVYAPPVATQNAANRAARQSVPIQVAVKLAGAIQTIDAIINVNR